MWREYDELGFLVYSYLTAQQRALEFAILRTLGFSRGQVFSLVAWTLAVLAIRFLHKPLTAALADYAGPDISTAVLAFALLYPIGRRLALLSRSSSEEVDMQGNMSVSLVGAAITLSIALLIAQAIALVQGAPPRETDGTSTPATATALNK